MGVEIFRTCPDRPWCPPSLLYNGYRVFPGSKERPGRDADPSPISSAVGHERVELYLYSPYGPYGLYRTSVPVQGCSLPLPLTLPFLNLTTFLSLNLCVSVLFFHLSLFFDSHISFLLSFTFLNSFCPCNCPVPLFSKITLPAHC